MKRRLPEAQIMGHIYTNVTVRGEKTSIELKDILVDTGATYTVLPRDILEKIGASKLPVQVDITLGNGQKVKAQAYGVVIGIEDVEAPAISITFPGAQPVIGVETLESIGLRLDPTTGKMDFTRPKGVAYFFSES